ncbi:MAG: FtsQ-type POTRA domain-containing protein [Candidatus Atribacteria bacterium]|nr:MAG: FtsQ-type POTRA domain-containing protein [Candidatus Atribacteria bacterium]
MQDNSQHRRSDKVRRRLNDESTSSVKRASTRISDPGPSSSFYLEDSSSAESFVAKQARKANGFFKIGWRLVSFLIIGACSFALLTAWRSPQYRVTTIQIKGLNRLSEDEVQNSLDLYEKHIFALEKSSVIEPIIRNFPELRDVRVDFSLPGNVYISVKEREPMITWQSKGNSVWIDSESYLIPARGEAEPMLTIQANSLPGYKILIDEETENMENVLRDKPQIKESIDQNTFFAYPKQIDGTLLTAILQLNAWMPEESVLLYQQKRGIGWKDIRGWDVFIGSKLENINDKMLMYETIVRKLEEQGIHPSIVSVEFLHAPYYRLDE